MFAKIRFFRDKSKYFTNAFVHELKPISLKQTELLYQLGDEANDIYFISKGRIKLLVDLHEFIQDQRLLQKIKDSEEKQIRAASLLGSGDSMSNK